MLRIPFAHAVHFCRILRRRCSSGPSSNRPHYPLPCERQVNNQINNELFASQFYLSYATYFAQPKVALFGAAAFFATQSDEERGHAAALMAYQNLRGGCCAIGAIEAPRQPDCPSLELAIDAALQLETRNMLALLELHAVAVEQADTMLADFVASRYLADQQEDLARYGGLLTRVRMMCAGSNEGVGAGLVDAEMAERWPYRGALEAIVRRG